MNPKITQVKGPTAEEEAKISYGMKRFLRKYIRDFEESVDLLFKSVIKLGVLRDKRTKILEKLERIRGSLDRNSKIKRTNILNDFDDLVFEIQNIIGSGYMSSQAPTSKTTDGMCYYAHSKDNINLANSQAALKKWKERYIKLIAEVQALGF